MPEKQNANLGALEKGDKFRVEISTANLQRCEPEFAPTKAAANRRKKELASVGYVVAVFAITPTGGLQFA